MHEDVVHQLDHRGVFLAGGGQGGRIHRQDGVDRLLQVPLLDIKAGDGVPDVPFRGSDELHRHGHHPGDRVGGGDIQRVAQSHHQLFPVQFDRQGEVAARGLPRDHLPDGGRHDQLANVDVLAFGTLGKVGSQNAGIDKLEVLEGVGEVRPLALGFPAGQVELGLGDMPPDGQPVAQLQVLGAKPGGILRRIHPVHQPMGIQNHAHMDNLA